MIKFLHDKDGPLALGCGKWHSQSERVCVFQGNLLGRPWSIGGTLGTIRITETWWFHHDELVLESYQLQFTTTMVPKWPSHPGLCLIGCYSVRAASFGIVKWRSRPQKDAEQKTTESFPPLYLVPAGHLTERKYWWGGETWEHSEQWQGGLFLTGPRSLL